MIDSDWCIKTVLLVFNLTFCHWVLYSIMYTLPLVAMIAAVPCRHCKMKKVVSTFLPNGLAGIVLKNKTF